MKTLFAVSAALLLLGCDVSHNRSEHVELILNPSPAGPATTFELRFDQQMASPDQIGRPVQPSPLVIKPELDGVFTWLSPRSGEFLPSKPLAMDRRYELSLRSGLHCADGNPAKAFLRRRFQTPPLSVTSPLHSSGRSISSEEVVPLFFNAPVRASDLEPYIEFRDQNGRRQDAQVQQGGGRRRFWEDEFPDASAAVESNHVLIQPRQPLPVGEGWHLVLKSGLPAIEKGLHLRARAEIPIGDVLPFLFERAVAHNMIESGASYELQFSKRIASSLAEEWSRWIDIQPSVSNVFVTVEGRSLALTGDFRSGTSYQITIRRGLPAEEPFSLDQTAETNSIMPAIPPRLYWPAFSEDQQAAGNRQFPLMDINVPEVRVRAKLLEPETAIYALRGYDGYFKSWDDRSHPGEEYLRVDYNLMAGRTVFDEQIKGSSLANEATNVNLTWDRLLGGRKTGIVFLEAESADGGEPGRRLGTQALMQLTDLGLAWKSAVGVIDAFVFSQTTGRPANGASVRLFDDENQKLAEAVTDSNGLASLVCPTNAQWIGAALGQDFHALKIQAHELSRYGFDLPISWDGEPDGARRMMLFSDREFYRPNETLHLNALAREWTERGLTVPSGLAGTLECLNPRGQPCFSTNVQFSSRGSCAVDVPLPQQPCGNYIARLLVNGTDSQYPFELREFQPNSFEVTLQARAEYQAGQKVEVPVSAGYYFGQPLLQASVKWTLEVDESDFKPAGFESFAFISPVSPRSHWALSGQTQITNKNGCVIAPEIPSNSVVTGPCAASLLVETTDLDQQTVSREAEFLYHGSDFYLGLRQSASVLAAGQTASLEMVAVGADGHPWPFPVAAHLRLRSEVWEPVMLQGAGRTIRYRPQESETNVVERDLEMSGLTSQLLTNAEAGQYKMEITATDPHGRFVSNALEFWISTPAELGWNYQNEAQMELKPDRAEYAPGDTARILVKAPFSGQAWVTVEREKVLRSFTIRLEGNAPGIELPVELGDSPNVFVSVLLERGSDDSARASKTPEFRLGYCQLPVRLPETRLAVSVLPAVTNILPGRTMEVTVTVNNVSNAPVPGAEVTLFAVDEGVLSLGGAVLPDPSSFFYAARPLAVRSSLSLPNLMPEDFESIHYANKGYTGGGGGRCRVRKNFLACAFWNATLTTGRDGAVTASFVAPDSLTRYRVMAVAHLNGAFGSAQSSFEVSKPLLIESALPQFAHVGDQLIARALVHNQSHRSGHVVVKLDLDNKALASCCEGRVSLPAGGTAAVEFPVTFTEVGKAKWVWRASMEDAPRELADAAECSLDVGYVSPVLHQALCEKIEGSVTNLFDHANPQLLAGKGTVTVRLSNTRLSELGEAASQLLHYPYGCVEQTGSSTLPWVVMSDTPALRAVMGCQSNEIDRAVRAGIERLFTMQTPGGGLGYWPQAQEPMLWASAYGAMVLTLAQKHGWSMPEPQFDQLLDSLGGALRDPANSQDSLSDGCFALYSLALAGRAEPAYHEKLFSLRGRLGLEDQAMLALAILEANGPRAMAETLLVSDQVARIERRGDFDCEPREQAIRLLAWIRFEPKSPQTQSVFDGLMSDQRDAHWGTTQGNAWALLALAEYARCVEGRLQPCSGAIRWQGQEIPFSLDAAQTSFEKTFVLTGGDAPSPGILDNSARPLYAGATFEVRPPGLTQPRENSGFGLLRRYERLDGQNQPCGGVLAVGDRVRVTLELSARDAARYVVVDDPLPAVLEPVPSGFGPDRQEEWIWSFHEFRKDRALFFGNSLPAGEHRIRYYARVRAAGSVTAPSGKVEEMYHPQRFGLTGTQSLEVK